MNAHYDVKTRIKVSAAVIVKDGKVLLAKRAEGTPLAGLWEFPGGKVEKGEDFFSCIKRELKEELGLNINPKRILQVIEEDQNKQIIEIAFIECNIEGALPPPESTSICWVTLDELLSVEMPLPDQRFVQSLKSKKILLSGFNYENPSR